MQQIECFTIRELYGKFNIPAVQRGLVWNAAQICNLWDSIAKGYPIGSFIAYTDENDNLQLLDGQQRLNSLMIAFGKSANADKADSSLWVKLKSKEDDVALAFMVCTPNNPWGFRENGERFDAFERANANKMFLSATKRVVNNRFSIASVTESYPWENFSDCHIDYVPMHLLSMEELDFAAYTDYLTERNISGVSRETFDNLYRRVQTLLGTKIPVIISRCPPSNVMELFQRINKGGERLSGPDEIYSAICAYCGEEIKKENNNIAEGFMPPERLIQLALRMAKTLGDEDRFCASDIEVMSVKKWFYEERNVYVTKMMELYNGGGTTPCLRRLVEQIKNLFLNENDSLPISIFLNKHYCWENWILVIMLLLRQFGLDYFESKENKRYLKLLAMLPYVTTSTTVKEKADRIFSETFFNAVNKLPRETPLLELIAIGLSCVMLKSETFVFPWPSTTPEREDVHRIIQGCVSNDMIYRDKWALCILKYKRTQENPLLFYYQREYVNEIINGTHFNPAFRSATDVINRPWDMDHIFPDANWRDDKNNIRDLVGNMQVMFFSDNRAKRNLYNGYSSEIQEGEKWFRYPLKDVEIADVEWQHFIEKRLLAITKDIYDTLCISELISKINELYCFDSAYKETFPIELKNAIKRYECLSSIFNKEICFACLQYSWKQQSKNVQESDVAAIKIDNGKHITFYESLAYSLALYHNHITDKNAGTQIWATIEGNDLFYQVGIGRPFGIGKEEWRKTNGDNWWIGESHDFHNDGIAAKETFIKLLQEVDGKS